jgi:Tol biopolymer transport system component
MRVPDSGGTPVTAMKVAPNKRPIHRNPYFLPDGRRFLYGAGDDSPLGGAMLKAGSLDGDLDRKVLDYASNVALVGDWLITAREPNLLAQKLDLDTLELVGKPVPVARNVDWYWARFNGLFSAGGSTLVYRRPATPVMHFLRLEPDVDRPVEVRKAGTYNQPRLAPDGGSIIVNRFDASTRRSDPWMYEFRSGTWTRMTFTAEATGDDSSIFSPDGTQIAIASSRNAKSGLRELWTQPVGGGSRRPISSGGDYMVVCDWSRDGRNLIVSTQRGPTGFDIEVFDANGGGKMQPVVRSTANEINGRLSPDGRWLVYESDESGRPEIYVTSFPSAAAKWQVSTEGGRTPYWNRDGSRIFFLNQDHVMSATVRGGETFSNDVPRTLESMGDRIAGLSVATNGTMAALRVIDEGKPPLSVVVNWQQMLHETN